MLFPVHGPPKFFFGCTPGSVLKVFASRGAFSFILEAMAQILAVFAFRRELSDAYISFVDNTAAIFAIRKSYSSDETMNILASVFWATAADDGSTPWFERVSSAANPADAVSRGEFLDAWSLGAVKVEDDFGAVWPILQDAVSRHAFADSRVGMAAARVLAEQSG